MKTKIALLSLLGLLLCGSALADVYSLDQLLELARSGNRGLQASRDAVEAARSGVTTAGAFPNPDSEVLALFANRYIVNKQTRQLQVVRPRPDPIAEKLKGLKTGEVA